MFRLLLILVLYCVCSFDSLAESNPAASFRRGVAIHDLANWAPVSADDPDRYVWPPFDPERNTPDSLLRNLAAAGFDFIRLTVDPGPFLQFAGRHRDDLDTLLVASVQRLLDHGFAVIVDFHPNSQVPAYEPLELVHAVDHPLFLAYAEVIRRTAGLLGRMATPRVALELMNEPQYGGDAATAQRWQEMLEILHERARVEAPDLLIVLTGARGGSRSGLALIDPAPFQASNVLYSFHYYEPHDFTHQGVGGSETVRYRRWISGLPYPASSVPGAEVWRRIADNILSDPELPAAERLPALLRTREKVFAYLATGHDRAAIAADFDVVSAWAEDNGVDPHSIILGEFGIARTYGRYRAADLTSLERWLHDVRVETEKRGFRWSIWVATGYGGMSVVENDHTVALNKETLRALGLSIAH